MFNRLTAGMLMQREAGAFAQIATGSQKRKYKYYVKRGYSEYQSKQLAKGNYVTR